MLQRLLEPEVMDTPAQAIAYDDMDHAEVNRQFVADLLAITSIDGEVLDLGAGTARIPIEVCKQCEDARVLAVDLSESMLDVARINVELADCGDRILLDRIDAKQLPLEDDRFPVVISNSIVHHIPEPLGSMSEACRVTRPGGLLFFRDLMRPTSADVVDELVQQYAEGESVHAREMFDASLRAALNLDEVRDLVVQLGFAADTVQATSDRHWTWAAHKR